MFAEIFQTTLFLYAPQILNPAVSTALILLIARTHGAEGIAQYTLALSFLYIGQALAALGLAVPIMRTIALARTKAVACLNAAAIMGLLAALAVLVLGRCLLGWLGYPEQLRAIITVSLWGVLPSVVRVICEAVFVPLQKAHYVALVAVAENVVKVVAASVLLLGGYGIFAVCLLIVGLRTLTCGAELLALRHTLGPLIARPDTTVIRNFLSVLPVFGTGAVVGVLVLRGDVILLSKLAPIGEVGVYSAAARIVFVLLPLGTAFAQALLTPMSQHSATSTASFDELSCRSLRYMGMFATVASFALCVFAGPVVSALYGSQFTPSIKVLTVMSLGLLPAFLSNVYGSMFFATHNEAFDFVAKLVKLVVLFGLIALLCPRVGVLGTAMAWVSAQFAHSTAQWVFLAARNLRREVVLLLWRPGSALLGGLTVFAAATWFDCPLGRLGSSLTFLFLLGVLETLSDAERRELKALPRRLAFWSRRFVRRAGEL